MIHSTPASVMSATADQLIARLATLITSDLHDTMSRFASQDVPPAVTA